MEYEVRYATQDKFDVKELVIPDKENQDKYHVIIESSYKPEGYSLLVDAYCNLTPSGSEVSLAGLTCYGYTDSCSYMYNLGMMTPESKKDWAEYINNLVRSKI